MALCSSVGIAVWRLLRRLTALSLISPENSSRLIGVVSVTWQPLGTEWCGPPSWVPMSHVTAWLLGHTLEKQALDLIDAGSCLRPTHSQLRALGKLVTPCRTLVSSSLGGHWNEPDPVLSLWGWNEERPRDVAEVASGTLGFVMPVLMLPFSCTGVKGQLPAACGASLTHLATSSPLQLEGADEIGASPSLWFVYLVVLLGIYLL